MCAVTGCSLCVSVVSLEGRAVHLATLVQEAEQRVTELQAQVHSEGPSEQEGSDQERQLKAWEWRLRLFRRMQSGFEHASKDLMPLLQRFFLVSIILSSMFPLLTGVQVMSFTLDN